MQRTSVCDQKKSRRRCMYPKQFVVRDRLDGFDILFFLFFFTRHHFLIVWTCTPARLTKDINASFLHLRKTHVFSLMYQDDTTVHNDQIDCERFLTMAVLKDTPYGAFFSFFSPFHKVHCRCAVLLRLSVETCKGVNALAIYSECEKAA